MVFFFVKKVKKKQAIASLQIGQGCRTYAGYYTGIRFGLKCMPKNLVGLKKGFFCKVYNVLTCKTKGTTNAA